MNSGNFNALARLAKLPRLYRLIKMFKLVRMMKMIKDRNKVAKYLNTVVQLGVGFERLIFFILIFFLLCHIMS
jgi:hypothetical protein